MMRIAVVDDYEEDCRKLSAGIQAYFAAKSYPCALTEYIDGKAFQSAFCADRWDIVFLDIYLQDITGMQIAKEIRKTDRACRIVFVTNSEDHAVDSYTVRASYYLVKPVREDALRAALDICLEDRLQSLKSVEVTSDRQKKRIRLRDIRYVAAHRNALLIHTTGGVEKVYASIAGFESQLLCDGRFLKCYHGCIVNMDYIVREEEDAFHLEGGDTVQIKRRGASAIRAAYHDYLFRQCREK